jgi:hypothetical protein
LRNKVSRDDIIAYLTKFATNKELNIKFEDPLKIQDVDDDSEWLIPVPNTELRQSIFQALAQYEFGTNFPLFMI